MSFSRHSLASALSGLGTRAADSAVDELFARLDAAYGEPGRHYHDRTHVIECLRQFEPLSNLADRPNEIRAALWFHDAVYDTRRGDNEERSAEWASASLTAVGAAPDAVERVRAMIVATKTHVAEFADAAVLIDVDLGILGAPAEPFERYDAAIRREYAWVPEDEFRHRRASVLRSFIDRPAIYATRAMRERLEQRARANLNRKIGELAQAR